MPSIKTKFTHEFLCSMHDKMRANGRRAYGLGRRSPSSSPAQTLDDLERIRAANAISLYPDLYERGCEYRDLADCLREPEGIDWYDQFVYEEVLVFLALVINTVVPTVLLSRRISAEAYRNLAKTLIFTKVDLNANAFEQLRRQIAAISKSKEFLNDELIAKLSIIVSRVASALYGMCPSDQQFSPTWRADNYIDCIWLAEGFASLVTQAFEETDSPNNAIYIKDAVGSALKKLIHTGDDSVSPALLDVVNNGGFAVDINKTYIEEAEPRLESRMDRCADELEGLINVGRHKGTPGERILWCIKKAPTDQTNDLIELVIEAIDDCFNILSDY